MVFVENVAALKDGMDRNALVLLDTIGLMEFVELVIPILAIMEKIASVTMDTMEIEITAMPVTPPVENVQDQVPINV